MHMFFQLSFSGNATEIMAMMRQKLLPLHHNCPAFPVQRKLSCRGEAEPRAHAGSAGTCSGSRWMSPTPSPGLAALALYHEGL